MKLVQQAARGTAFIVAKARERREGPLNSKASAEVRRPGFLAGQISVPEDFDRIGAEEIGRVFGARVAPGRMINFRERSGLTGPPGLT